MLVLLLIAAPVLEVFAFIEVGQAIGWLWAVILLLGVSLLGTRLVRVQGRAAIDGISLAVSERRPPGRAAVEGALGFIGALLLVIPGFVTDALGALLLLPPARRLVGGRISSHFAGRVMSFAAGAGRFTSRGGTADPADVESTAVEDDLDQLGR
ncbi:MAG TPA: FxsA family protein [Solirubrobacteraceae bacterium]|jgi:UPF0716 protein FxsA|nr:FxsA family protein [Solirubrobacteraceae bacterium]